MKIAIIGSRKLVVEQIENYLPEHISEIVSGGATGIDTCAREYALKRGISFKEFLPDYPRYGKAAPLLRNIQIIEYADEIYAFWDGKSTGTMFTVREAKKKNKTVHVFVIR